MAQRESDAYVEWARTLPKPARYALIFGSFMGGGALILTGVMGLVSPPAKAGAMHWLSHIGFVVFLGPLVLRGAVVLLRRGGSEEM